MASRLKPLQAGYAHIMQPRQGIDADDTGDGQKNDDRAGCAAQASAV
jgi:hypothetical protein